ncbi:caspase family protein [Dyadobacter psychrotolerans]|uniref:NACHT domain-containing protein n=1 Tax=Dyadobacter psychrotolerans TaxID=2541721 RepID=A0A4R5DMX0_9BACT|nr:caspase family protein [Dyadobacter psychrotolerans]TDE15656.1 NACHT domain-containing protein [Dyadobacter psychrotolerans]
MGLGTTAFKQKKNRKNHLFLVGIDQYQHWPKLTYPVSDCQRFNTVLKDFYGFSDSDLVIQPLYDQKAETDILIDEMSYLAGKDENGEARVKPDENLIIYFSGHGHFINKEGYWVAVNAPKIEKNSKPSEIRKNLISVSEVVKVLSNINAHHIVLIVDACFSEAFAAMEVEVKPQSEAAEAEDLPSRWVLTAGRNGPVPNKSPFANALVDILTKNQTESVSINWLGAEVTKQVRSTNQRVPNNPFILEPLCKSLVDTKYKLGEFFFHRKATLQPAVGSDSADLAKKLWIGTDNHFERLQKGRYKYLNIEKILGSEANKGGYLDVQVKTGDRIALLDMAVSALWNSPKPHTLLFGDGGMGKTMSLLLLWQRFLFDKKGPIPIFIPLHEYNSAPASEREDFLIRYICKTHLDISEPLPHTIDSLWELFETSENDKPRVVLLLDGLNEVTVPKSRLMSNFEDFASRAAGAQMVLSSRHKQIEKIDRVFDRFSIAEILPLSKDIIEKYLGLNGLGLPKSGELVRLFANPMMLTLYAGANSIAAKYRHDDQFQFKKVTAYGELMWNFNEAQLAQLSESANDEETLYQTFLLRVLVPYIAYRMEDKGRYAITIRKLIDPVFNLKLILEDAFRDLNTPELAELYPAFAGKRKVLGLADLEDMDEREQRAARVTQFLVERLRVLVMEGDDLRFLHQNFRDFFAVCHIRNMTEIAILRRTLPEVFIKNDMPVYLRRMIGEIEGEHHVVPFWNDIKGKLELPEPQNLLSRLMALCKTNSGIAASEAERASVVRNIIAIWLDLRQTLAGADLTNLDLSQVKFNGLPLTQHKNKTYLSARFEGSILYGQAFSFDGHYGQINQAHYSADGKKLLTASDDHTVKEWLISTCKLLQTFSGHMGKVISARYSPDGEKILSASHDGLVIEWSQLTGDRLATYEHVRAKVNNAVYSPDNTKILTAADDKLVREWDVATRECTKIYTGHSKNVSSAYYSKDGQKIISASADACIREWSVVTGDCLRVLSGHTKKVNTACYSPNEKNILSASDDHSIIQWSAETGQPLNYLNGHVAEVLNAIYSPDGTKIVSASSDKTIREWSSETCKELRSYEGHTDKVNFVSYSPNKLHVVSASNDKSIREWNIETGIQLFAIKGQSDWVLNRCVISPDEKKLLTVNYDRTFSEIDIETGICLQTFRGHEKWIQRARYSSDGTKLVSGSEDLTVREWSVETGECIHIYHGHQHRIEDAVFNLNGTSIISCDFSDNYREWSTDTGKEIVHDGDNSALLASQMQSLIEASSKSYQVKCFQAQVTVKLATNRPVLTFTNVSGLLVQSCDFRKIDPKSVFSDAVMKNLRSYGAIFNYSDEAAWKRAIK